jgi:hypothetical protein
MIGMTAENEKYSQAEGRRGASPSQSEKSAFRKSLIISRGKFATASGF